VAAAARGDRSALFIFRRDHRDVENRGPQHRDAHRPVLDSGLITVQQIDAVELSPGEFADTVRRAARAATHPASRPRCC
jgi:circadian clock protein KaiC